MSRLHGRGPEDRARFLAPRRGPAQHADRFPAPGHCSPRRRAALPPGGGAAPSADSAAAGEKLRRRERGGSILRPVIIACVYSFPAVLA